MKAIALSARDRKTLVVGVSVIGSLILVSRGIPAWTQWQRRIRDDATVTAAEAAASQRAVRIAPMLARTAQLVERRYFALAPALLAGEQPAAAGAALISTVNSAARTAGVQLGALQIETDSTAGGIIAPLRVRGDGAGDIAGVAHFLAKIENGTPLLSIRELTITPTDPHLTSDKPETLRLNFLIEGVTRYTDDGDDQRVQSRGTE